MIPAAASGIASASSVGWLVVVNTAVICTTVATEENTAPDTSGWSSTDDALARAPIAPMVAVLDTKPPASPATGSPARGPSARIAM